MPCYVQLAVLALTEFAFAHGTAACHRGDQKNNVSGKDKDKNKDNQINQAIVPSNA
jgi:hypothetical protein